MDGSDGRDEGDSRTLDTALRGLPLVCKVGLSRKGDFQRILPSLTVDDALEFGKYFWFILQGGGEGNGVAQSVGRPAPILDAFTIMRSAAADVHLPQLKVLTTTNILLRLKNDFVKYLQEKQLGWSIHVDIIPLVGVWAPLNCQQAPIPECLVVSTFGDFLMF